LIIFPTTILLNFSVIALATNFWSAGFWPKATNMVAKIIISIVNLTTKLSFTSINLDYPFLALWISCTIVLVVFAFIFLDFKKEILKVSLLSFILLFFGIFSYQIYLRNKIRLRILDNSLIITSNNNVVIVCGEQNTNILENLKSKNYLLNYIIVCNKKSEVIRDQIPKKRVVYLPEVKYKSLKFDFWNNKIKLLIFKAKNKNWLQIRIKESVFLICMEGGDVQELPEDFKTCSTLIAFGLPNNFDLINFKNILLKDSYFSQANSSKISRGKIFLSDEQGSIIDVNTENGQYKIKRKI
jgi:hypothetical protein